jgi:hypothetical protein
MRRDDSPDGHFRTERHSYSRETVEWAHREGTWGRLGGPLRTDPDARKEALAFFGIAEVPCGT